MIICVSPLIQISCGNSSWPLAEKLVITVYSFTRKLVWTGSFTEILPKLSVEIGIKLQTCSNIIILTMLILSELPKS